MRKWILMSLALGAGYLASAQKIKYKDLFPLLEAQNYSESEPLLRQFLSDEKNDDEANAHYQFAVMMEKYFRDGDIVSDSATLLSKGDSAVMFYQRSLELIDDRELRKNDEYYQSFYRRDLRTGDFGIKLSDVHLDIEKKIEGIRLRQERIVEFGQRLQSLKETEQSMVRLYNDLISSYSGYDDFLMKSGLDAISKLGTITDFQVNLDTKAEEIVALGDKLGILERYTELELRPLESDFVPIAPVMTLDGSMEAWDVGAWVAQARSTITGDVSQLKQGLGTLHEEITNAKTKLSGSVKATFATTVPVDLSDLIAKYDPACIPREIIRARISENIVISLSDSLLNPDWKDSLKIAYHVETCDSISTQLKNLGKLLPGLAATAGESGYYDDFFRDQYGSVDEAKAYLEKLANWTSQQRVKWDTISDFWDLRNNWGITNSDTIPLHRPDTSYTGPFQTIGNWPAGSYDIIAYGVKTDSLLGFIARFGPDRRVIWETRFESALFADGGTSFQVDTLLAGLEDIAFYLYAEDRKEEENLTVVSFSKEGTLNWSTTVAVEQEPVYSTYSEGIRQHTIFLFPQEAYPLPDEKLGYIVIDRNGEAK